VYRRQQQKNYLVKNLSSLGIRAHATWWRRKKVHTPTKRGKRREEEEEG